MKNKNWPRNEIDRFILARLEKEGLKPSAEAEKHTLIRCVTLVKGSEMIFDTLDGGETLR